MQGLWTAALFPFFIALADLGENLSIARIIAAHPQQSIDSARMAAAYFSMAKNLIITACLGALAILSVLSWTLLPRRLGRRCSVVPGR